MDNTLIWGQGSFLGSFNSLCFRFLLRKVVTLVNAWVINLPNVYFLLGLVPESLRVQRFLFFRWLTTRCMILFNWLGLIWQSKVNEVVLAPDGSDCFWAVISLQILWKHRAICLWLRIDKLSLLLHRLLIKSIKDLIIRWWCVYGGHIWCLIWWKFSLIISVSWAILLHFLNFTGFKWIIHFMLRFPRFRSSSLTRVRVRSRTLGARSPHTCHCRLIQLRLQSR